MKYYEYGGKTLVQFTSSGLNWTTYLLVCTTVNTYLHSRTDRNHQNQSKSYNHINLIFIFLACYISVYT